MKITFPHAPAHDEKAIIAAIQAALQAQVLNITASASKAGGASLSLSHAYPGYSLRLDDLAAGNDLSYVAKGMWHQLVFINNEAVADAQLTWRDDKMQLSALSCGPMAASIVDALNMAEKASALHGKSVELRLLSAPALHFIAVWLHGENEERFIPVAPTPDALMPMQLVDKDSLFGVLLPAARALKQKFDADTTDTRGN
ncbi:hypothetical protein GWD52_18655 [Enterobacteriaceae bacterium 4M9]|nr:hypothetical protein [Enterobacteriaceae bacterium 4M9]